MAPICVAIVGLSSRAKTSWAAEGHLPYLLSARGKQHYEIVALLNSSAEAAAAAKEHFNLPSSVRTYGDPAALAADPDIDLVVVNTRVDAHAGPARPSLEAGKAVFIEWPVADNAAVSRALLDPGTNEKYKAALERSVIGLQGPLTPILLKVKEILSSGRIGKILSSEARMFANILGRDSLSEGLAYFAERKVGGSPLTITYGHVVDYLQDALGEFCADSVKTTAVILHPEVAILKADGKPAHTVTTDVPEYLAVQGRMRDVRGRGRVAHGAPLVVTMRNGPPFKGQPAFEWTINGEKGEVLLTSPSGPYIFSGHSYDEKPRIRVHDHATDKVTEVEWAWEAWQEELGLNARSTGEVYERYAAWWEGGQPPAGELPEEEAWPRLLDAQRRMDHLQSILEEYDTQAWGKVGEVNR